MNIYAYTLPNDATKAGLIKVGQAGNSDKRIKEQIGATRQLYKKVFDQPAIAGKRNVSDHDVHRLLAERGFERTEGEWFRCSPDDVKDALDFLKQKYINEDKRDELSEKFYQELRNWYYWATEEQYQGLLHEREPDPDHALRIIVRLLLIFFLKEKELVPKELFDEHWINETLKADEYRYYKVILRNLFFYSLNTPENQRKKLEHSHLIQHYNKVKEQLHRRIPFLNGGLFNEHPGDDFALNDDYFFSDTRSRTLKDLGGRFPVAGIIKILSQYKYTLDETDSTEYIDPEFIGKTFECLLACIEADSKESRRKVTGSYYTPREIVDYMVNEALDAYLDSIGRSVEENLLLRCTILDPACGSGAFPCGVMNVIMQRIDPHKTLTQSERYAKKLEILRNVIYGVDIQPMAVQISTLRLFLSLLQEIIPDPSSQNFGIIPLPNLDYKFVVADTLMGINGQELFFHDHVKEFNQLVELQKEHFRESNDSEKSKLKVRIEKLEKELAEQSESKHIEALCRWNHSDTSPSPYFDSRWMFGIEKFDIIIGNPPYGAKYSAEQKDYFLKHYESAKTTSIEKDGMVLGKQKGSLDTFSLFIENGFNRLRKGGYLMFIVPLSVVSSDSMTALHELLLNNSKTIKVSSYAKRPAQIFCTSCVANTIIGLTKTNTRCERLWTTKMNRLPQRKDLVSLLGTLKFTDGLQFCMRGRIPKISLPIEKRILKKLFAKKHTPIRDLIDKNGNPIYYRVTGGRYFNVVTNAPTVSMKEKPLYLDKKYTDVIGAILSSSFFWWYQQVYTNGLDLKSYEIESFPIPVENLTLAIRRKIEKLYERYLKDIERHVIERESQEYTHITKYKEYKIRYSKALIDAIDDIICPLYGLTKDETEFIKNYELRFRKDK